VAYQFLGTRRSGPFAALLRLGGEKGGPSFLNGGAWIGIQGRKQQGNNARGGFRAGEMGHVFVWGIMAWGRFCRRQKRMRLARWNR